MGLTYADNGVENLFSKHRMPIRGLVDSGAVFMTIPDHIAVQSGYDLEEASSREVILKDGSRKSVPMAGPLRVHFAGWYCDLSALVFGDAALFGAVPMEMMDLVLHPATQMLVVNPASPFVPVALAKQAVQSIYPSNQQYNRGRGHETIRRRRRPLLQAHVAGAVFRQAETKAASGNSGYR
jgi:hypothetical protein